MYFYDWRKIYRKAGKKPANIVTIFQMSYKNIVPLNNFDKYKKFYGEDYRGKSFLINPEPLWEASYHERSRDIAIYLALASLRSWPEYELQRTVDLNSDLSPITNLKSKIFNEELVYEENGRIKFFFEENLE